MDSRIQGLYPFINYNTDLISLVFKPLLLEQAKASTGPEIIGMKRKSKDRRLKEDIEGMGNNLEALFPD